MFLRLYNVKRVLFLVDRIELGAQAQKEFDEVLKNDFLERSYGRKISQIGQKRDSGLYRSVVRESQQVQEDFDRPFRLGDI